jgi:hypothetical protein
MIEINSYFSGAGLMDIGLIEAGFISMGLAVMAGRKSTVRSEDMLTGSLAVLAFLGIVATLVEDFIGRWILS